MAHVRVQGKFSKKPEPYCSHESLVWIHGMKCSWA